MCSFALFFINYCSVIFMCYMQPCIVCFFFYNYCSVDFMCVYCKFYVFFYYKFIFTSEFIKHDQVNYSCCDVRYLDLYFLLGFLNFNFFFIVDEFFFIALHNNYWVV